MVDSGWRLCDVRTIGLYTGYMRLRETGSERITCIVWVDKPLSKYRFGRFIGCESLLLTWALEHICCEDGKWTELALMPESYLFI
jgi:hypothetical protein